MNEQQKKLPDNIKKYCVWFFFIILPLSVCAYYAYFLWELYVQKVGHPFNFKILWDGDTPRSAMGAFGDFIGGLLNPLFAFLSFIALLYTLKLNQEELAETRKELARAAQAQEDSKKVMDEQLKTQALQQFENNFYQLFTQLNKLQDDVLKDSDIKINQIMGQGQFNRLDLKIAKEYLTQSLEISRYFILLYQIMKLIDQELRKIPSQYERNTEKWKAELKEKKKFYTNLLRSVQDNRMLQLLFINCYDDQFLQYKDYLKEASFFEHMSLTNDVGYNYQLLCALPFYISDDKELKKSKNIPFFDEGLGLSTLTQPEIAPLLKIIYRNKEKPFNEMDFLQQITCDFLHVHEKTVHDKNVLLQRLSFLRESSLNLEFQIIHQNILKEIDIKINRVIFNIEQIHIVGDREELIVLDLDKKHVLLKRIESGDESHLDGIYP